MNIIMLNRPDSYRVVVVQEPTYVKTPLDKCGATENQMMTKKLIL